MEVLFLTVDCDFNHLVSDLSLKGVIMERQLL